jgi:hypothetical protein
MQDGPRLGRPVLDTKGQRFHRHLAETNRLSSMQRRYTTWGPWHQSAAAARVGLEPACRPSRTPALFCMRIACT